MMETHPEAVRDRNGGAGRRELSRMSRSPSQRQRLARRLGWMGIGLGFVELAVPGILLRTIGIADTRRAKRTVMALGVREIVTGVGIIASRRPRYWVGSRVDGDFLDIGLLVWAMTKRRNDSRRIAYALAAVGGITVLDVWALAKVWREQPTSDAGMARKAIEQTSAVTISGSREEILHCWQLIRDEKPTAHDEPMLAEAPGDRGIEVRVRAKRRFESRALEAKLRRLKQLVETGEVIQSDASLHKWPHPARPSRGRLEAPRGRELLR